MMAWLCALVACAKAKIKSIRMCFLQVCVKCTDSAGAELSDCHHHG